MFGKNRRLERRKDNPARPAVERLKKELGWTPNNTEMGGNYIIVTKGRDGSIIRTTTTYLVTTTTKTVKKPDDV